MRFRFKDINYSQFLLPSILLLALLLRIWNISQLYYFGIDEEIMDLIERRIVLFEHIPLIGSFSPIGTYLGPYFYYFGALILFFSDLNPLGQGFFSALLGTGVTLLIYKVGQDMFGKSVGIFASTIYASSFLMVIFDRRYWHLTPGPLLSLLVLYALYKIKLGSIKYVYLLTAALIWGWNTDYTNLILFLFTLVVWLIFHLPLKSKHLAIALIIFIISNAPLVVFDLRHDFLNSQKFIGYFTNKFEKKVTAPKDEIENAKKPLQASRAEAGSESFLLNFYTYSRLLYTNSEPNITLQQSYCKQYIEQRINSQGIILLFTSIIFVLLFIGITLKQAKGKALSFKLLLTFYLVFLSGIFIYSFVFHGDVFEHYQATLLPVYILMTAVFLGKLYRDYHNLRYLITLISIIWVLANINLLIKAYNPLGFENKQQAVKFALMKIGDKPFFLDSIGSCHSWDGFYYTFLINGRHPDKSYLDDSYSWLYNYIPLKTQPSLGVIMVPKATKEDQLFYDKYNLYNKSAIDRASFGELEVLIVEQNE